LWVQYELENGKHCGQQVCGRGFWLYCVDHKEEGPNQAKRKRNKESNPLRQKDAEKNRLSRYLSYHSLTKPKLRAFFDHADAQQEYDFSLKYEGYEYALTKLNEIKYLILNPPADLPSAAQIAHNKVEKLLEYLLHKKRDAPGDSTIDQLMLSTLGLQRDIGEWLSAKTFTNIGGKARVVREMMLAQGETLGFAYGLFVDVEIARTQCYAHYTSPKKRQSYANKARNTLSGAEVFCDLLVERSTGERKQVADFLRFYVDSAKIRLAFDTGEQNHIASLIRQANERATAFANAYGSDAPIVATVQFLNFTNQAEYQLQCGDFDCSAERRGEAEDIFNDKEKMPWHSIEALHRLASLKTHLALQNNESEREKCVHEYLSVLDRYPCPEYRHILRELKTRYDSQIPDVDLLTLEDESLYI
jgi:hypothetical protein